MPQTLLDWLMTHYPTAKRQTLKRMLENGRVMVNGRPARKLSLPLSAEDQVRVSERPVAQVPPARKKPLPFAIVHEDVDVLVVNKPAGLLTSTVKRESRPTLWAAVREYLAQTDSLAHPGLIHRLDRDAAGLLVFSKNDPAYRSLKTQFFKHTVGRVYTAITHSVPNPRRGQIKSYLVERADGSVYSTTRHAAGQRAITDYEVLDISGKRATIRVTLHTGRKHQIRVHFAQRGAPIIGDTMYGGEPSQAGLMLAATSLEFEHPRTGKRVKFEITLPSNFETVK